MTEAETKKAVIELLEATGWELTHFSIPRRAYEQLAGVPDIFATHPGHLTQMWIETKGTGKPTRPAQDRWLARTQASGAICLVIDSVDKLEEHLRLRGYVE